MMQKHIIQTEISPKFVRDFNAPGPYYTSYPTLANWPEGASDASYKAALKDYFGANPDAPIWFYVHLPYCAKLCYYCICNIHVTNNRDRIQRFVDTLLVEIRNLGEVFAELGITPNVKEIHFGGGTPSHFSLEQLHAIRDGISRFADMAKVEEFSMEIDPRTVEVEDLDRYKSLGVERISFGVQDFNPEVQKVINREQPYELVERLVNSHIRQHYNGVNFDLLYGLPLQTIEGFRETVQQTITLAPDRVTLLKYAHIPDKRKHMGMIKEEDLPDQEALSHMFVEAAKAFQEAGYEWVGIDNFIKSTDALARANRTEEGVYRNFSGYSPGRAFNVLGVGPTTTHMFGPYYFQSMYDLQDYTNHVEAGEIPVFKGYAMDRDDELRRHCIFQLQCNQQLDIAKIEALFGITFSDYFPAEVAMLEGHELEGNVAFADGVYRLTDLGRFHVRHVCRVFDKAYQNTTDYKVHGP